MNNEELLQDLKQFIEAMFSQNMANLATKQELAATRQDISNLEHKLVSKIDDLSAQVADALDTSNEATQEQLDNHETRLTTLEQKAA